MTGFITSGGTIARQAALDSHCVLACAPSVMFKMKKILIILILVSPAAFAKTLPPSGFVGKWELGKEIKYIENISLVIDNNFNFKITRKFSDGDTVSCNPTGPASFVERDLLVLTCKTPQDVDHKFLLGGWVLDSGSSKIFGTMFLYDDEGLFNGIPVYFTKT